MTEIDPISDKDAMTIADPGGLCPIQAELVFPAIKYVRSIAVIPVDPNDDRVIEDLIRMRRADTLAFRRLVRRLPCG